MCGSGPSAAGHAGWGRLPRSRVSPEACGGQSGRGDESLAVAQLLAQSVRLNFEVLSEGSGCCVLTGDVGMAFLWRGWNIAAPCLWGDGLQQTAFRGLDGFGGVCGASVVLGLLCRAPQGAASSLSCAV